MLPFLLVGSECEKTHRYLIHSKSATKQWKNNNNWYISCWWFVGEDFEKPFRFTSTKNYRLNLHYVIWCSIKETELNYILKYQLIKKLMLVCTLIKFYSWIGFYSFSAWPKIKFVCVYNAEYNLNNWTFFIVITENGINIALEFVLCPLIIINILKINYRQNIKHNDDVSK